MTTKNKRSNTVLLNIAKAIIFLFALYLAYLILRPLLTMLLGISFWIIKLVIFLAVGFLVIHLFLKLIFNFDLIQMIFGRNWRK